MRKVSTDGAPSTSNYTRTIEYHNSENGQDIGRYLEYVVQIQ